MAVMHTVHLSLSCNVSKRLKYRVNSCEFPCYHWRPHAVIRQTFKLVTSRNSGRKKPGCLWYANNGEVFSAYLDRVGVGAGRRADDDDADVISLRGDVIGSAAGHDGVVELVAPGGGALAAAVGEPGGPLGEQVEHVGQLVVLALELLALVGELALLAPQRLHHRVRVATGRRQLALQPAPRFCRRPQLFQQPPCSAVTGAASLLSDDAV